MALLKSLGLNLQFWIRNWTSRWATSAALADLVLPRCLAIAPARDSSGTSTTIVLFAAVLYLLAKHRPGTGRVCFRRRHPTFRAQPEWRWGVRLALVALTRGFTYWIANSNHCDPASSSTTAPPDRFQAAASTSSTISRSTKANIRGCGKPGSKRETRSWREPPRFRAGDDDERNLARRGCGCFNVTGAARPINYGWEPAAGTGTI